MLQNDTFCIFFCFHSTSRFVFWTLDAEKKKHWGRGECDSSSEGNERTKLKKWDRLYSGVSFFNCCVHPCIPPAECYCDLVSCSEQSMMGERSPLSGSPLILCISSFPFVFIVSLGVGLCVVGWRVGTWSLRTGTLLSSQRASGSTTNKQISKHKVSISHLLSQKVRKYHLKKRKYTLVF